MIIGSKRKIKFKDDIVDFVRSRNKFLRKATIQYHFEISSAQVYKLLRELIKEGRLARTYRKYYGLPIKGQLSDSYPKVAKKSIVKMIQDKEISCPDLCMHKDVKCQSCVDFSNFDFHIERFEG